MKGQDAGRLAIIRKCEGFGLFVAVSRDVAALYDSRRLGRGATEALERGSRCARETRSWRKEFGGHCGGRGGRDDVGVWNLRFGVESSRIR